jgi:hypothetical protein
MKRLPCPSTLSAKSARRAGKPTSPQSPGQPQHTVMAHQVIFHLLERLKDTVKLVHGNSYAVIRHRHSQHGPYGCATAISSRPPSWVNLTALFSKLFKHQGRF